MKLTYLHKASIISGLRPQLLFEAFSKTDFFDLYTLLYVNTDQMFTNDEDIHRMTVERVFEAWEWLIDNLSAVVISRFSNPYDERSK